MSLITNDPFVELFWIKSDGNVHTACFPQSKAQTMLSKHLIPQQEAGIIRNAGIREIN